MELSASSLAIMRNDGGRARLTNASEDIQDVVRGVPEAILARSVIVCEGKTEVGMLRALNLAAGARCGIPMEHRGVAFVDGGGSAGPSKAIELARLGYRVLLFRDSDVDLAPEVRRTLLGMTGEIVEWKARNASEDAVLAALPAEGVQAVLDLAFELRTEESVMDAVRTALATKSTLPTEYAKWDVPRRSDCELRSAIGRAARKGGWFKQIEPGERFGAIVVRHLENGLGEAAASVLKRIEAWAHG